MPVTDEIASFRVICEGGLNTNENSLVLSNESPGSATQLVNYETSSMGGYRRINGFVPYDTEYREVGGTEATGRVLGVWMFYNSVLSTSEVFAARANAADPTIYNIWKFVSGSGWVEEDHPVRNMTGFQAVVKIRTESFNFGSGNNMILVDGANKALWYDGTAWVELSGDQSLEEPAYVTVFKNHVIMAGDLSSSGRGRLVHSGPNDPTMWNAADGAGQLFPGFDVIQIKPFRDELYIFGQDRIKKAVPDVESAFLIRDVTNDLGCIASDSVVEIGGNLIFLSYDGIRPIAGTDRINDVEMGLLSKDIQPIIDDIVQTYVLDSLDAVVIKKKTQFRYFITDGSVDTKDAKGILGSIRSNSRIGRDWEFGELRGIRTSCTWYGLLNRREVILHGDFNGEIYVQEVGSSFDTEDIYSVYSTPYLDVNSTDIRKLWRKISVFINSEGSVGLALGVRFDWDKPGIKNPPDFFIDNQSDNPEYNDGVSIYNDGIHKYASLSRSLEDTKLEGSSFSVRFSFVNHSKDSPFTIQALIPEYSIKGRQ